MSSPSMYTRSSRSISSQSASAIATRYVAWPSSVRLPRGSAPCPAAPASTCWVFAAAISEASVPPPRPGSLVQ